MADQGAPPQPGPKLKPWQQLARTARARDAGYRRNEPPIGEQPEPVEQPETNLRERAIDAMVASGRDRAGVERDMPHDDSLLRYLIDYYGEA